jgi:hypothetical protein
LTYFASPLRIKEFEVERRSPLCSGYSPPEAGVNHPDFPDSWYTVAV